MRARKLFLASAVLFLVGFFSLGYKWNGSAGFNAGDSISAWSVSFNGSVQGWPAMIGILCVVGGLVLLLIGTVRVLME